MITLTEQALEQIQQIISEPDTLQNLRVFVQGGGCAGFNYGFTLEEQPDADDMVFTDSGVTVIVDPMSYTYLTGSVIDYRTQGLTSQFVIENPLAVSTCGCGSSFSI
jgi:iron-sulfur cluster insertion protein